MNNFEDNKGTPTKRTSTSNKINIDTGFENPIIEVPNQISENPSFPDSITVEEEK